MKVSYTKKIFYFIFTVIAALTVFIVFFKFGIGIDGKVKLEGFSFSDTFSLKYTQLSDSSEKLESLYPDNEFFTSIINKGTNLDKVITAMRVTFYLGIASVICAAVAIVLSFTNIFMRKDAASKTINKTTGWFINAALALVLISAIVGNVWLWAVIYNSDAFQTVKDAVEKAESAISDKTHGIISLEAKVTPNVKMIVVGIIVPIIGFVFANCADKFSNAIKPAKKKEKVAE